MTDRDSAGARDEGDLPDKLFFRIGEAATLVGVEPHVLRYWETEFRLRPQRSASGQRMYRRRDIVRFLRIRRLLHEEGFTIAGARKALQDSAHEPAASTGFDTAQTDKAREQVVAIRQQIANLRQRIAQAGVGAPLGGDTLE